MHPAAGVNCRSSRHLRYLGQDEGRAAVAVHYGGALPPAAGSPLWWRRCIMTGGRGLPHLVVRIDTARIRKPFGPKMAEYLRGARPRDTPKKNDYGS